MFGHPGPGVVVGFAFGVVQLERRATDGQRRVICIRLVRMDEVAREEGFRKPELPLVDVAVVTVGEVVAVEASRNCFVAHERDRAMTSLGSIVDEGSCSRHVIDVAVGVDGGVDLIGRPCSHRRHDRGCRHLVRHVEQNQSVVGRERHDVAECLNERDAGSDLFGGRGRSLQESDVEIGVDTVDESSGLVQHGGHVVIVSGVGPQTSRRVGSRAGAGDAPLQAAPRSIGAW